MIHHLSDSLLHQTLKFNLKYFFLLISFVLCIGAYCEFFALKIIDLMKGEGSKWFHFNPVRTLVVLFLRVWQHTDWSMRSYYKNSPSRVLFGDECQSVLEKFFVVNFVVSCYVFECLKDFIVKWILTVCYHCCHVRS